MTFPGVRRNPWPQDSLAERSPVRALEGPATRPPAASRRPKCRSAPRLWGLARHCDDRRGGSGKQAGAGRRASPAEAVTRLLNPGLNEYLIPTHADALPISGTFIEEHDACISPLGSKGIGELPVVGHHGCRHFHATGRRIRHLPIKSKDLYIEGIRRP
jgi:hypothetical protein